MGYILVITMAAHAGRRGGDEEEVEAAFVRGELESVEN